MKEEITNALLREFLLGKLSDEECEQIENLFLTDSRTRERVAIVEQDLIEDYLEDSLTQEDRERFLSRYAQTDEQRRKLKITRSIRDWAITEATIPQAATASVSVWGVLRTQLRLKPLFVVPIAVIILITIVLVIISLNRQIEQRKRFAISQELAQLNSPSSLREVLPQMQSLELSPVTARSVEPIRELSLHTGTRVVELRLPWVQNKRYLTYRAEVRLIGGDNWSFTIPDLKADTAGPDILRIRLPVHILIQGQYQVHLSGIADDGSLTSPEEYSFFVSQ